ncbi:DNA polymerase I [Paraperlucidibaca baekdonensis]|uniref:DNA polymerase I n=1 Tax=Paraperlucidibaca baekdonensis TaxID=748120 RepID=A0A3E0H8M5_9GAMM|nr:DNA polymerase I [Paraperlucidibaca baekdonensis]REH40085.1 DNA polymerase I [Paraperlucidibaca baekdonensis]
MTKRPPLILVDGSSYLYRAYHAMPPLTTQSGQATGAIKGVVNMLKSLLKQVGPTHVAVVFDAPGKTFRDDIFPEYKAHRPPMPDDMRTQIAPLHAMVKALGLPLVCTPGVEADDVIGTLAQRAAQAGWPVLISTGDKDLAQLVNADITLVNTMTNVVLDEAGVLAKFGVRPDQIIDYLMLIGDSSDGIPGVPSVGPKTAVKWLTAYDTLENIEAHAADIKGKVGEKFRDFMPQLGMTRELVTIKCDVEIAEALEDFALKDSDEGQLLALYDELEFRSWANELRADGHVPNSRGANQWAVRTAAAPAAVASEADNRFPAPPSDAKTQTHIVATSDALQALIEQLAAAKRFAIDTETTSLNYIEAALVGISVAITPGEAWYVPVGHAREVSPQQLPKAEVLAAFQPLLESESYAKVLQHAKYDMHILANEGITLRGVSCDTMLASYVLDATATRHNLADLGSYYLGRQGINFSDIAGKGAKAVTFERIAIEQAAPYAGEDADFTLQLANLFDAELAKAPALQALLLELELPVQRVLQAMEYHGTLIDPEVLRVQTLSLTSRLHWLETQVYELAGETFNLSSPKQLGVILFEKLGIAGGKKTASGQYSTAEDVLEQLAHPLPALVLEHRSLAKLRSTYTDKLPEMMQRKTGRVHTSYHQAVAATGRLSSSDPNLQNIPIRTEEGRRIRQAFVAPPGCVILAADYSQIELRIMAHLSRDAGLLSAFQNGLDVHKATAAEVLDVAVDAVTHEQRRAAKAVNFGLIYGMSAFGLAKQLDISRSEAADYIARYFARYPGVQEYMERTRAQAHEQGYVETLYGRRLMLRDIRSPKPMLRQAAERAAINAPMQGTAADIIKRAMLRVQSALAAERLRAVMVMQVHDELVLEVPETEVEAVTALLKREMAAAADLAVPLEVDVGVGKNWDEAH